MRFGNQQIEYITVNVIAIFVAFLGIKIALRLILNAIDLFIQRWYTTLEYKTAMKIIGNAPTTENQIIPYTLGSKGFGQFSIQKLLPPS